MLKPDNTHELSAWIRLSLEYCINLKQKHQLLANFGLPQNIFEASTSSLAKILPTEAASKLSHKPDDKTQQIIHNTLAWLEQSNNYLISLADPNYPQSILDLSDAPVVLYASGDLNMLRQKKIAIVGSRSATPQGLENSENFAFYLAKQGWNIVSGLANGIDAYAHMGAIRAGSTGAGTIAVLGSGLDSIYPNNNQKLAEQIRNHGLLLTEFNLGTAALPRHFPMRNRLVAALALGVIVVEAATRSGSLITARIAGDIGREVFAIPGSIHSPLARGCHQLIRQGAKLVESGQDIIEELGQCELPLAHDDTPTDINQHANLDHDDRQLIEAMGYEPSSLEALQQRTQWPIAKLMDKLTILEIDGYISRQTNGSYSRN